MLHRVGSSLLPVARGADGALHQALAERMAHYSVPGLCVALLAGGDPVVADAYGVNNARCGPRVDVDRRGD